MKIIDRRRDDKSGRPASEIEVEALGPLAALLSGLASLWSRVADWVWLALAALLFVGCAGYRTNTLYPERVLAVDRGICKREVLSYLPPPTILTHTYEELKIVRVVWRIEFDKQVGECLEALGWERRPPWDGK